MSEITVSVLGESKFKLTLDLVDPSNPDDLDQVEVWRASFCDEATDDCEFVFFEMGEDYEAWDLIDEAIRSYREQILPE